MKIVLMKGLSYFTPGMNRVAEKGKPIEVEKELAEALMATGKFVEADADATEAEDNSVDDQNLEKNTEAGASNDAPESESEELTEKAIDSMRMAELLALAEKHGIDISECKTNDDRKAIIKEILFSSDPFDIEE